MFKSVLDLLLNWTRAIACKIRTTLETTQIYRRNIVSDSSCMLSTRSLIQYANIVISRAQIQALVTESG